MSEIAAEQRADRLVYALRPFAIPVLLIAVFAWTNWYFSPERRLLRLAESMNRSSVSMEQGIRADKEIWASPLQPEASAERSVHSACAGPFRM